MSRSTDASIAFSVTDNLSASVVKMKNTLNEFSKDAEGLQKQLDILNNTRMQLKNVDLKNARQQVEQTSRALRELGDSATEADREAARADFDQAIQNYSNLEEQLKLVSAQARQTQRDYLDATDAISKADNRAASVSTGGGAAASGGSAGAVLSALGKAGLLDMAGDVAMDVGNLVVGSAFGSELGGVASSGMSGALSGAAIGSIIPGIGTAVGAVIGGGLGLLQGGTQAAQGRDDAFKSYVQESVEGQLEEMDSIQTSGSATAGQREQDQIAFSQRFGSDEAAQNYLDQVRSMAVNTNYTYDEITGYSKSLLNSYSADETLDVLQKLSDATAGLNLESGDVSMFIAGLSRMRTTDKATQEYLNYFSERGLDVYEALSRSTGADKSQISEMVTDGEIGGTEAAQAILDYIQEEFGGLSEKLASTYDAMVDNLGDAEANLNARMGEGYNEARKAGIEAQQEWLDSEELGDAYEAIGAWKAELENAKEQYVRDAVNEAMSSEEYQTAQAEGDAAEMGRIIMQAKIQGMNEYNANEGKDEVLAQEIALIDGVREDASLNDSYWNAGYTLGQEFSKGRAAGMSDGETVLDAANDAGEKTESFMGQSVVGTIASWLGIGKNAWGLDRVPYDNYLTYLHEGERVLTASQAREMDRMQPADSLAVGMERVPRDHYTAYLHEGERVLDSSLDSETARVQPADSLAAGMERVPRDHYTAYLYEGAQVLPPTQARETDRGGLPSIHITVSGNTFGAGLDEAAVAEAIADTAVRKIMAGFQG